MFNGHIDTVPPFGMKNPFEAIVKKGKLFGRGSADMKSGVGAMAYALVIIKRLKLKLKGDLIFAGVIDEDASGSAGTRYVIEHGPKTDFAIVGEPTLLYPVITHKGIDYFEVKYIGKSAHSSIPEKGANAIFAAAEFVTRLEKELSKQYRNISHPLLTPPTVNAGLIQGYAQANKPYLLGQSKTFAGIVPDICSIIVDIRWVPDQSLEEVTKTITALAQDTATKRDGIRVEVKPAMPPHPAMEIDAESPLVKALDKSIQKVTGDRKTIRGENYWGDSGLLSTLGHIPTVMFGPGDIRYAHSDDEFIEIDQLAPAAKIYALTALNICGIIE